MKAALLSRVATLGGRKQTSGLGRNAPEAEGCSGSKLTSVTIAPIAPIHVGTAQLRRLPICRNNFHLHKWGPLASFTRSDISAAAQLSLEWRSIDEQISGICDGGSVDRSFNARIGMLDPSEFNGFRIRLSAWRFNEQSVPGRVQTQGWAVVQLLTGDRVQRVRPAFRADQGNPSVSAFASRFHGRQSPPQLTK